MLTEEQVTTIKEQLLKQLLNFPENQRDLIKNKIISMSNQEIEEFIKQNRLSHLEKKSVERGVDCIFCNISNKNISSYILDEDKDNLLVLELNPLSKGHSLVIPKNHQEIEKIPSSSFGVAKKIAKKIKAKFNPKEIKISAQKILGHGIIEILPLYGQETERKKATEQELKQLQEILKIKRPKKRIKEVQKKERENLKIPKLKPRIP